MGNFSRDSFKLTNVMHGLITGEPVTDPRHYISLRVQQGVPLLDADINEAVDIQRRQLELLLRDVVGDGVPGLGQGFALAPLEVDNDFAILPGVLLLGGWQIINPATLPYSQQARFFDSDGTPLGTDLTTPVGDRIDSVYVDAWEDEVGSDGPSSDPRIVDTRVGVETSVRVERRWAVRVAEGVTDWGTLTLNEAGHKYALVGRLFRSASARVQPHMIEDQRRLGLTLADSIKAIMFLKRGTELVNAARYSDMLVALRQVLQLWERNSLFPIVLGSLEAFISYANALNRVYGLLTASEVSSDTGALSNADGLTILGKLADAQAELVAIVREFGNGVPAAMAVLDTYEAYLDGDPSQAIAGIRPSLAQGDLLGGVKGQEALTDFLGVGTGALPAGGVTAVLDHVTPPAALIAAGTQFVVTYKIQSQLVTPTTPEAFDLEAVVTDVRWATALSQSQVTLAPNASAMVDLTVTPLGTLTLGEACDIRVIARAHRRPSVSSFQPAVTFTIGALPPGEAFLFYSGGLPLDGTGTLQLPRAALDNTQFDVAMTLINSTGGAQTHTFTVDYELAWPSSLPTNVDKTQWIPSAPVSLTEQNVVGASAVLSLPLFGQDLSAVTSPVEFTVHMTATLTKVNGVAIAGGKSMTVDLPIVVATT